MEIRRSLGQSGPCALGGGEDSPTPSIPRWAQGARKFDLTLGYVMGAERPAGVGRARRWGPLVRGLPVCSRRNARGYLAPFCGRSRSSRGLREARRLAPGAALARLLDRGHPGTSLV